MLRYLGTIAPANGASKNNTDTPGTPFVIPNGTIGLRFLPSVNGLHAEVTQEATPSPVAASSFATDATKGWPLGDPANILPQLVPPVRIGALNPGARNVVAVFNNSGGAGSVKVWAVLP